MMFQVFEYLDEAILSSELVSSEEYYQRRIHSLITDFIVLMHSKLMEMRVKLVRFVSNYPVVSNLTILFPISA